MPSNKGSDSICAVGTSEIEDNRINEEILKKRKKEQPNKRISRFRKIRRYLMNSKRSSFSSERFSIQDQVQTSLTGRSNFDQENMEEASRDRNRVRIVRNGEENQNNPNLLNRKTTALDIPLADLRSAHVLHSFVKISCMMEVTVSASAVGKETTNLEENTAAVNTCGGVVEIHECMDDGDEIHECMDDGEDCYAKVDSCLNSTKDHSDYKCQRNQDFSNHTDTGYISGGKVCELEAPNDDMLPNKKSSASKNCDSAQNCTADIEEHLPNGVLDNKQKKSQETGIEISHDTQCSSKENDQTEKVHLDSEMNSNSNSTDSSEKIEEFVSPESSNVVVDENSSPNEALHENPGVSDQILLNGECAETNTSQVDVVHSLLRREHSMGKFEQQSSGHCNEDPGTHIPIARSVRTEITQRFYGRNGCLPYEMRDRVTETCDNSDCIGDTSVTMKACVRVKKNKIEDGSRDEQPLADRPYNGLGHKRLEQTDNTPSYSQTIALKETNEEKECLKTNHQEMRSELAHKSIAIPTKMGSASSNFYHTMSYPVMNKDHTSAESYQDGLDHETKEGHARSNPLRVSFNSEHLVQFEQNKRSIRGARPKEKAIKHVAKARPIPGNSGGETSMPQLEDGAFNAKERLLYRVGRQRQKESKQGTSQSFSGVGFYSRNQEPLRHGANLVGTDTIKDMNCDTSQSRMAPPEVIPERSSEAAMSVNATHFNPRVAHLQPSSILLTGKQPVLDETKALSGVDQVDGHTNRSCYSTNNGVELQNPETEDYEHGLEMASSRTSTGHIAVSCPQHVAINKNSVSLSVCQMQSYLIQRKETESAMFPVQKPTPSPESATSFGHFDTIVYHEEVGEPDHRTQRRLSTSIGNNETSQRAFEDDPSQANGPSLNNNDERRPQCDVGLPAPPENSLPPPILSVPTQCTSPSDDAPDNTSSLQSSTVVSQRHPEEIELHLENGLEIRNVRSCPQCNDCTGILFAWNGLQLCGDCCSSNERQLWNENLENTSIRPIKWVCFSCKMPRIMRFWHVCRQCGKIFCQRGCLRRHPCRPKAF